MEALIKDLISHGVTVELSSGKTVICDTIECNGFFLDDPPELKVATGNEGWEEILLHEYSHFRQWVDGVYMDDMDNITDTWLAGEDIENPEFHILKALWIEWDCERRTIELVKNKEEYAQKANAYLFFYRVLFDTRKWYGKIPPYRNPKIVSRMPTFISDDHMFYWNNVPEWYADYLWEDEKQAV